MLQKLFVILSLMFSTAVLDAQDIEMCMRELMGVTELESIPEDVIATLYELNRHPIDINNAGRSVMEASGIFTPYQMMSLSDYLERHGAIMSLTELAAVDGFTPQKVAAMKPFIRLDVRSQMVGHKTRVTGDVSLKGGYKTDTQEYVSKVMYGARSRMSFSDKFILAVAANAPYDSHKYYPTLYSANLMWGHRAGKVIVGDFNARFGQGLCMWNTASFSSLVTPSAFMRRPSGIAAANSYTGSSALTGAAADCSFGRWKVSAALAFPSIKQIADRPDKLQINPCVNVSRYGAYGYCGINHTMTFASVLSDAYRIPEMATSIDGSCCIKGINLFGEIVFDWVDRTLSLLSGVEAGLGERWRGAALGRYLPDANEHGVAVALEMNSGNHQFKCSADVLYHPQSKSKDSSRSYQVKSQADWIWNASSCLETKLRVTQRLRTWGVWSKSEIRADVCYKSRAWSLAVRADGVYGKSAAALAYVESRYAGAMWSAALRYGVFHVDNWDDRIYVYERDAPGNFNVPFFYGRGMWASAYVCCRVTKWVKLYLRAIYKKPGNAELKLYCELKF